MPPPFGRSGAEIGDIDRHRRGQVALLRRSARRRTVRPPNSQRDSRSASSTRTQPRRSPASCRRRGHPRRATAARRPRTRMKRRPGSAGIARDWRGSAVHGPDRDRRPRARRRGRGAGPSKEQNHDARAWAVGPSSGAAPRSGQRARKGRLTGCSRCASISRSDCAISSLLCSILSRSSSWVSSCLEINLSVWPRVMNTISGLDEAY